MTAFCDLEHATRFALRDAIEFAGGEIMGYQDEAVQVAVPNTGGFFTAMREAGLDLVPLSLHYFPLGTDKPADSLRHDGRYPGSKGFWLFGRFTPGEKPCT